MCEQITISQIRLANLIEQITIKPSSLSEMCEQITIHQIRLANLIEQSAIKPSSFR